MIIGLKLETIINPIIFPKNRFLIDVVK